MTRPATCRGRSPVPDPAEASDLPNPATPAAPPGPQRTTGHIATQPSPHPPQHDHDTTTRPAADPPRDEYGTTTRPAADPPRDDHETTTRPAADPPRDDHETTTRPAADPPRDDHETTRCPVCRLRFTPAGRQLYCSSPCRKTAFRRRRQQPASTVVAPARPRRGYTVYECPDCGQLLAGEQRCGDCGTFARRVGPGGACPHCQEPVTLTELLGQEVILTPRRS